MLMHYIHMLDWPSHMAQIFNSIQKKKKHLVEIQQQHPHKTQTKLDADSSNQTQQQLQATMLGEFDSDSIFMDGDERELLARLMADNPTLLSFQNGGARQRTVEECLIEAELEKHITHAQGLMASRRSQMSREARIQILPSRHTLPSIVELRSKRQELIDAFDVRENGSQHLRPRCVGEDLCKEVALASVPRNTFEDCLGTLLEFYHRYIRDLSCQRLLLIRRWFQVGKDQLLTQQHFSDKNRLCMEEIRACKDAYDRLVTLHSFVSSVNSLSAGSSSSGAGGSILESLARHGKVPLAVAPMDAEIYVNHHIFQQRARMRFERFVSKARMIPQYKRYCLFDGVVKYMLGFKEPAQESRSVDMLPSLISDDASLLSHLEELCAGFKLSGFEKADLHEFLYHLGKRFGSTHEFQSLAWHFKPLSIVAATDGTSEDLSEDDTAVFLRASPWATRLFADFFPRTQPDWEVEQMSAMKTLTALKSRSVATSADDHLRIDIQLDADFTFISEESVPAAIDFWKKRSSSFSERASPSVDFGRAHPDAAERVREFDTNTQLRLQAVYQLRYLRSRQFRLQILKTLNYFAAILKGITRDCRGGSCDVSGPAGGNVTAEGLSFSFAEERRRDASIPMVSLDGEPRVPDVDDLDSAMLAAGRDALLDAKKSFAEERSSRLDPFWFEDVFEPMDYGNSLQRSTVRDGVMKVRVMEEWALAEIQRIEQRMLFTASYYLNKHTDSMPTGSPSPIDTTSVVEDIYECELWFQQAKLNVVEGMREAYLHSTNRSDRSRIAKSIVELVCSVPRLDLSDASFMPSFTNQVVVLDLTSSLLREVIQHQIETERRVLFQLHSSNTGGGSPFYGFPSVPSNEAHLFKSLFPRSSVINIFEVYGTLGVVGELRGLIDSAVDSILSRFRALDCQPATVFLQREVIQEMLVQWRLLSDEEILAREGPALINRGSKDPTAGFHTAPVGTKSAHPGGLLSPLHVRDAVEKLANERAKSGESDTPDASQFVENPSRFVPQVPLVSTQSIGVPTASEDARSPFIPAVSHLVRSWFDAMEAVQMQAALTNALYENEVWCGVHRMQAKLMGVTVKQTQMEPMDFDGKRVFSEADELEAAIHSAVEAQTGEGPTSVFSLGAQLALEDVLAHSADSFQNLAVCEFEKSMGDFDVRSAEGVGRLLRHRLGDFRRAFAVQIANKNIFISVVLCNMSALDGYLEGLYKSHADSVISLATENTPPEAMPNSFLNALYAPREDFNRVRLSVWPLLVKGESPQQYFVDRRQLQRLFVSANQIKSVHRKCVLQEMSHQATLILGGQGDAIRRELKDLKASLIDRYCADVSLACIQYAQKYQICALSAQLRFVFSVLDVGGEQSFFIFGGKNDVIRSTARGAVSQGESRKQATCLVARNGTVDEARYVPHFAQVLATTFESDSSLSSGMMNVRPDHFHTQGHSHTKQSFLLRSMSDILHHWHSIVQIVRCVASCQLPSQSLFVRAGACADLWKSELFRVASDLESLRDPTDLTSVVSHLSHRHTALYLSVLNTLRSLSNGMDSHRMVGSSLFSSALNKLTAESIASRVSLPVASLHASRSYFPRCDALAAVSACVPLSQAVVPVVFEPLRRIREVSTVAGSSLDVVVQDAEGTVSTSPFCLSIWFSDFSTLPLTNSTFSYLQWATPFAIDRQTPTVHAYRCLDQRSFLCSAEHDERLLFFSEFSKFIEMVEDCTEDVQEMLGKESEFQTAFMTATVSSPSYMSFGSMHYDVACSTARRDGLKELYVLLLRQVSNSIPSDVSNSLTSGTPVEELYQRNIIQRSRTLLEREAADPVAGRGRRKGRCIERELRSRQCKLLTMEIHKLLMARTTSEVLGVIASLESEASLMSTLTVSTNKKQVTKTALFSEFCSLLVAKAHCTRGDGEKVVTYHIPDHSLNLAMDTVAAKLLAWDVDRTVGVSQSLSTTIKGLSALVVEANAKRIVAERNAELMDKALPRRILSGIAAERFDVIKRNSVLSKENETLRFELSQSREKARAELRVEFEDRVTNLQLRLKTRESQFSSYKQKLFRDMQESLEDVRRNAMFSISSMEHAPVHVKRQALKIAISDDELNTLREQNAELRQALLKTKLWYEIKLARAAASHEHQIGEIRARADSSQQNYWSDRGVSDAEVSALKRDLSSLQVALTKSELEVEVLRKDLQAQLSNKKDLIAWKMQSGKQLEDLQKRLRRFDKLSSAYDLEKLVSDHEKRLSSTESDRCASTVSSGPTVLKGQALRGLFSRVQAQSGQQSSNVVVPLDEYRKLHEQCERERRMKEQAFANVDEARKGSSDLNEALVWQRRYLESASELQRRMSEIEALKAHIDSSNIPPR